VTSRTATALAVVTGTHSLTGWSDALCLTSRFDASYSKEMRTGHSMAIGDSFSSRLTKSRRPCALTGLIEMQTTFPYGTRDVRYEGVSKSTSTKQKATRAQSRYSSPWPRPTLRGQSQTFSLFSNCGFRFRQICFCGLVIALSDKDENRVEDG
jgi:hypothetical protein